MRVRVRVGERVGVRVKVGSVRAVRLVRFGARLRRRVRGQD